MYASKLPFVREPLPAPVRRRIERTWLLVQERAAAMTTVSSFAAGAEPALMHGDVSGPNIVWSPAPVLIDWEFVRLGDPADEIASLFGQNALTASQRAAF